MDVSTSLNSGHAECAIDISDCFETLAIDVHHGETVYRDDEGAMLPSDEQEPLVHFELGTQCCHGILEILASPAQLAQVAAKLVTKLSASHTELMLAMLDFSQWEESAPASASPHVVNALFTAGNPSVQMDDEDRFAFYDQLIEDSSQGNEMVIASLQHAGIDVPVTRESIDAGISALWDRWKHVSSAIMEQQVTPEVRQHHQEYIDGVEGDDPHGVFGN